MLFLTFLFVSLGFPIALSYPHFMDGNPSLRNSVEGMNPDPRLHTTYFVINPVSIALLNISNFTQFD